MDGAIRQKLEVKLAFFKAQHSPPRLVLLLDLVRPQSVRGLEISRRLLQQLRPVLSGSWQLREILTAVLSEMAGVMRVVPSTVESRPAKVGRDTGGIQQSWAWKGQE